MPCELITTLQIPGGFLFLQKTNYTFVLKVNSKINPSNLFHHKKSLPGYCGKIFLKKN